MTAAAYGVAMIAAAPALALLAISKTAVIGWSRVAMGHHYVSDVVAGAMLGSAIAASIAALVY